MISTFIPSVGLEEGEDRPGWWFIFVGYKLLIKTGSDGAAVPFLVGPDELGLKVTHRLYLGNLQAAPCYAAQLEDKKAAPEGWAFRALRSLYGQLPESFFCIARLAVQLVQWDQTYIFCNRCGTRLKMHRDIRAKECPECAFLVFPRISPAVIVLVQKGNQLLLARSGHFAPGLYSVLAGFVEAGETLEEAVYREVKEEVGVEVENIRYFGSQPWPFPDSLMIAFTAGYAKGEICVDDKEIVAANWFTCDTLPLIPDKVSIARQLIDWFVNRNRAD